MSAFDDEFGLFGEDAERLLLGIRGRASGEQDDLASVEFGCTTSSVCVKISV